MGGGRGVYAGQPLTFKCPKCFVMDGRARRASDVKLTGRTRRASSGGSNYRHWPDVAREFECPCGHVGWSRHPDLAREAGASTSSLDKYRKASPGSS